MASVNGQPMAEARNARKLINSVSAANNKYQ